MKLSKLTSTQRYVVAKTPGMSSYLRGLEQGRKATPHSWLYENQSSDATLAQWREHLAALEHGNPIEKAVFQFDEKQLVKFGPQGEIPPISEALETIADQYEPGLATPLFSTRKWQLAKEDARKLLFGNRPMSMRPLSFNNVIDDMRERDTLTTNSGWPLFTRRSKPEVVRASIEDAMSGKAYQYPAIILFRYYNKKLRPVWMYPMSLNLIENSFQQVLQEAVRKVVPEYVAPWQGFEDVKRVVTSKWLPATLAFGGDVSAMDAHFKEAQMEEVFDVVKYCFQQQYWESLHRSMTAVNNIDIVVGSDAIIANQPHGIASGSGWTQFSETMFQFILSRYQAISNIGFQGQCAIGDDQLTFYQGLQHRAKYSVDLYQSAGLPANIDKQSDEIDKTTFLQRMFIRGWHSREDSNILGGVYPTIRALNSSLNPERFHDPDAWNSDMFCIRQFMILENTVDHPLFQEFVQFVCKGQKDLIPFAKKSAAELFAVTRQSRALPGLNPTYNQEKRDKPLASFESIKLAREL